MLKLGMCKALCSVHGPKKLLSKQEDESPNKNNKGPRQCQHWNHGIPEQPEQAGISTRVFVQKWPDKARGNMQDYDNCLQQVPQWWWGNHPSNTNTNWNQTIHRWSRGAPSPSQTFIPDSRSHLSAPPVLTEQEVYPHYFLKVNINVI